MGRGQDKQQRKNRPGLTAAQKKARKKKLAATAAKQSAARLQANNAAIAGFFGKYSSNPTTAKINDDINPAETVAESEANNTADNGDVNLSAEQNEGRNEVVQKLGLPQQCLTQNLRQCVLNPLWKLVEFA